MRLIDLDDDRHTYCGDNGEYERWSIDPDVPVVDAIPIEWIENILAEIGNDSPYRPAVEWLLFKYKMELLDETQSVDAIPIEWIQKYYADHPFTFVSAMLYDWAIEQVERKED